MVRGHIQSPSRAQDVKTDINFAPTLHHEAFIKSTYVQILVFLKD